MLTLTPMILTSMIRSRKNFNFQLHYTYAISSLFCHFQVLWTIWSCNRERPQNWNWVWRMWSHPWNRMKSTSWGSLTTSTIPNSGCTWMQVCGEWEVDNFVLMQKKIWINRLIYAVSQKINSSLWWVNAGEEKLLYFKQQSLYGTFFPSKRNAWRVFLRPHLGSKDRWCLQNQSADRPSFHTREILYQIWT